MRETSAAAKTKFVESAMKVIPESLGETIDVEYTEVQEKRGPRRRTPAKTTGEGKRYRKDQPWGDEEVTTVADGKNAQRRLCGARLRAKPGETCKRWALKGKKRCKLHGGNAKSGIAHPNYKHGRYCNYLPERMAKRFVDAQRDDRLMFLRDDLALLDVRLSELLSKASVGESRKLWKMAGDSYRSVREALDGGSKTRIKESMGRHLRVLEEGADEYAAWAEIQEILKQRQRIIESERKRLVEMQQVLTIESAMGLITRLTDIIRKHESDPDVLEAIATDIRELVDS